MSIRKWSFVTASAVAMLAAGSAMAQQTAAAAGTSVEAVVVTGSRLAATGFTAPTPVSVLGSAQLESRAIASVGEAVAELPSFRPGGQSQAGGGTFSTGQNLLDLRGLGATRTLILVDGIRPTPNNVPGTFDTNMLPSSLIDRTEVVTGGASAAYGSDAVAGVVNFILKDRMNGFRGNIQYGISQANDAKQVSASLGYGHNFMDDRLHLIVGGDYDKQDPTGTLYSRDWGKSEPGIVNLTTRPAGIPANIVGLSSEYKLAAGGLITSCVRGTTILTTTCPLNGTTFTSSGAPTPFLYGTLVGSNTMNAPAGAAPGVGNYGTSPIRAYRMRAGGEHKSLLGRATYDLSPNTTVWGQFMYGEYQVSSFGNLRVRNDNQIYIDRTNPFIPAATAAAMDAQGITQIRMNRVLGEVGSAIVMNNDKTKQFIVGAKGTVFGDWKWNAAAVTGQSNFVYDVDGLPLLNNFYAAIYAIKDSSGKIVCGPMASNPNRTFLTAAQQALVTPNCVPINLFGDGSITPDAVKYFLPGRQIQSTIFKRDSANVNLSGEPFMLPAGPLSLAVGAEWHKDQVTVSVDAQTEAMSRAQAWFAVNPLPGAGEVSAKEAYAEAGLPMFKDLPLIKALDLNAAVRRTDYSTSGGVTTWKFGGTWDLNDSLRFRATRSRDIRAPNITELFIRGNDSNGIRTNPVTNVSAQLNGSSVPNSNLQPEVADTFTAGVVFQPKVDWFTGFRASVDYYNIEIAGVIGALSFNDVLNRYYVQRDQSVASFITFDNSALGFSRVDSPQLNLNGQRVNGADVEFVYRTPADPLNIPGRFTLSANGSFLNQLETFDANGVTLGDLAGAIPKWRWKINLNYDVGHFGAALQANAFSDVSYRRDYVGPDSPNYNPAASNSVNRNVFPSFAYYSLSAHYALVDDGGKKLDLYGVIDNLLNSDPPDGAWAVFNTQGLGGSGGYNPYDGVGRYFKMGLRFQY